MTGKNYRLALEAGPYFWNADTIYNFLKETFNIIKPAVENLRDAELAARGVKCKKKKHVKKQKDIKKLEHFVKQLSGESAKVFGGKKWVDIMGTHIFNILKLHVDGSDTMKIDNDEPKKACVVQLLKLIRNKIEHMNSYSDDVKKTLPMFFGGDEELQKLTFIERFVSYWIEKYPRLLSFLWVKFYEFRNDLKDNYRVYNISHESNFSLVPIDQPRDSHVDLNDIVELLNEALISHLEKGTVLKRFKPNKGPGLLEFRATHGLSQTLDKSDSVSVQIIPGENLRLIVSHSKTRHNLTYVGTEYHLPEKVRLIFAENIESDEIWKDYVDRDCKIIVFGNEQNMIEKRIFATVKKFNAKNVNNELCEYPVTGSDLTSLKINAIFEDGEVCIQKQNVKIKDVFAKSEICKEFYGDFLNQLLRKEKPALFGEYEFPSVNQVDVERSLSIYGYLGAKREICGRDACYSVKWATIHMNTDNMLKNVVRKFGYENQKSFFIIAEPGGGKTQFLKSLGWKLLKGQECGLVIFIPFCHFVKQLENEINTGKSLHLLNSIKKVIQAILLCRQDSEKYFLNNWLNQQNIRSKFGVITLMLDGLDEIENSSKTLALNALETIQNETQAIRLWVTSRQSFPSEHDEHRYDTVRIFRFSENEQNLFFLKYFLKHKPDSNAVDLTAKCCHHIKREIENQLGTQIATTPLHCVMIAQLYEQAIMSMPKFDLLLNKSSLYEELLKKKIHIYMREKQNITLEAHKSFFLTNEKCLFDLHMYLALEYMFPGKFKKPTNSENYTQYDYLEMGIVYCTRPLEFTHKTFAEYLVARFMYHELISVVANNERFQVMNELLVQLFLTSRFRNGLMHAVTWKFLDEMLTRCNLDNIQFLTIHPMRHPQLEDDNVLSYYLFDDRIYENYPKVFMLYIRLWSRDRSQEFYSKALRTAMRRRERDFPLDIFIKLCKVFRVEEEGWNITSVLHYSIFESVLKNCQYEIAKYLIQTKRWFPANMWCHIPTMRKNGGGILHIVVYPHMFRAKFLVKPHLTEKICCFLEFLQEMENDEKSIPSKEMVKQVDNNGYTALMTLPVFVKNEYMDIRTFIVETLGADVNAVLADGTSHLCLIDDIDLVSDFDLQDTENFHKTLELFLKHGFNKIDSKTRKEGWTALACAVHIYRSKLQVQTLKLFYDAEFDFNSKDIKSNTILHFCVESIENSAFAVALIIFGSDISIKNEQGQCSLCLALNLKKVSMCQILLGMMRLLKKKPCGKECEIQSEKIKVELEQTNFITNDEHENKEIIQLLEEHKKNLPMFSVNKNTDVKQLIIEKLGANVNELLPDERYALCLFSNDVFGYPFDLKDAENYHKTLKWFIEQGFEKIDLKTRNKGWTALACAVHIFHAELQIKTLKLFHEAEFNFNARDKDGNTILHYCVESVKNAAFAIPLIRLGCDLSVKNKKGQCSLCLAVDLKKLDMCEVLSKMMVHMEKESCGDECKTKLGEILCDLVTDQTIFIDDDENIIQQMGEYWYVHEWLVKRI